MIICIEITASGQARFLIETQRKFYEEIRYEPSQCRSRLKTSSPKNACVGGQVSAAHLI